MVIKFLFWAGFVSVCLDAALAEKGLILQFGDADARVADQVALYVPEDQPASSFTGPGPFKATWQGTLNLEARSRLIFNLEGTGQATLSVDGEILCEEIGTASERKRLSSGKHDREVKYRSPEKGAARLRLFWEGRDFDREPVPASVFSHETATALLKQKVQLLSGHRLIQSHGCLNCHAQGHKPAAPSLEDIGKRLETSWLANWILEPAQYRPGTYMPKLFSGKDAAQKAADVAHFLSPPQNQGIPDGQPKETLTGGHIFYQQGCIGCHTLDAKGREGRIGLGAVATKYRQSAIAGYLLDPARHNDHSRMPDFGFSKQDANALERFLRSLSKKRLPENKPGNAQNGRVILTQSGCLNCHAAGQMKSEMPPPGDLAKTKSTECRKAGYNLSDIQRQAIAVALNSPSQPYHVPAEFARHQFTALRCAACHDRHGEQAYREEFHGEIAHLKPPAPPLDDEKPGSHKELIPPLDHLGFKLRPEWRTLLLSGDIQPKTRHWLKARMPAFPSQATELSKGFSHAAGLSHQSEHPAPADPEKIKTGTALTGITGFSCGSCHAIGEKPAFAVFEGEGPNFRDTGIRLRDEYFQLWMRSPMRQWPGTIMPTYSTEGSTPLTQYYDGDSTKQFDAIYHYLLSLGREPGTGKNAQER
jgi:cytochrome c551/c552